MATRTERFVVSRARWMRGQEDAQLLDNHDRMCCLGFVCEQRGLPREMLLGTPDPGWLMPGETGPVDGLLTVRGATGTPRDRCTALASDAIVVNDDDEIDDAERERRLSALFAAHGYEMVFES